jgi:hypothetical protein
MHHEHDRSRRIVDVDDDFVDQDADDALLEPQVRGRVMPEGWQILGERMEHALIDLLLATVRASKAARRPSRSRTRSSAAFQRASNSAAPRRMSGSTRSYRRPASWAS